MALIGLISSIGLCLFGLYRLFFDTLSSASFTVALIFAVTGFISAIGNAVELKKTQDDSR